MVTLELYKVYGIVSKKMRTFETEGEMVAFMKEKNLSWLDLITIKLTSEDEEDVENLKIYFLEETEQGALEYAYKADIVVDEVKDGCYVFSLTEDSFEYTPPLDSINQTLKNFIQAKQADEESCENARYSIYDVYTTRELL